MNIEKSFKCHFCKKLNHDLTQLPFNRLICEICIEYKCLNEFKGDDEPNEDLEKINAVGLFMDKIDKHYGKLRIINSKSSNNIGAKLYKIKNRVQDFKDYINNYENRINSKLGILRFELDWNYKNIQGIIEKKKLNLLNRVNLMENDIMENLKANRQNIRKAIDLFVEKNTAWSNYLNTETMKLKETFDYEIYKYSIESQINNYLIELNSWKFIGLKNIISKSSRPESDSFGKLEIKSLNQDNSEINGQIERKNFESIFSMDSILNIKSVNKNIIKSIYSIEHLNVELFVLHSIQNNSSFLKIFNKLGELCKEIKLDYEVFSINTNGSSIFVCHENPIKLESCEYLVKMSIFDGEFSLLESRDINFINFSDKNIVDICTENSKIYILITEKAFKYLSVYVFNLNIDLLNSFELNSSGLLNSNTKDFLKIYAKSNKIYVKQKSLFGSQINILNAIDGSFLKSVYLPYNFLHFYVADFEQKFPKNYPEIVEGKIVFFSNGKFYVYDTHNEKMLMKTFFYSSKIEETNFYCNFCITKDNQVVGLVVD